MTALCRLPAIVLALLVLPLLARGEEPVRDGEQAPVLERFAIAKNGDAILVPVTINDRQYQFLLDTGCTASVFDVTLLPGRPVKTTTAVTPEGTSEVQVHLVPVARLGSLPFQPGGFVAGVDLTNFRDVSGQEIHGMVGMDVLNRHVIQIDFDRGELRILQSRPANPGTPVPLTYSRDGLPHLAARVKGLGETSFLLDSGFIGCDSGTLSPDRFARLASSNEIRLVGRTLLDTLSGTTKHDVGRVEQLTVGELAVANPVFSEGRENKLGLQFLTRFIVTFDFPNQKLYLKKGECFADADGWNLSGLHIRRKMGKPTVHAVDENSPADIAGVKAGDRIVRVGDKEVESVNRMDLYRQCCTPGTLRLTLERDGKAVEVELTLKP